MKYIINIEVQDEVRLAEALRELANIADESAGSSDADALTDLRLRKQDYVIELKRKAE